MRTDEPAARSFRPTALLPTCRLPPLPRVARAVLLHEMADPDGCLHLPEDPAERMSLLLGMLCDTIDSKACAPMHPAARTALRRITVEMSFTQDAQVAQRPRITDRAPVRLRHRVQWAWRALRGGRH